MRCVALLGASSIRVRSWIMRGGGELDGWVGIWVWWGGDWVGGRIFTVYLVVICGCGGFG